MLTRKHPLLIAACLFLLACSLTAAPWASRVDALLAQPRCKNAVIGVRVCDAATGGVLYSRRAAEPLIPASNLKLATTAAALCLLGGDFTYDTTVALRQDGLVVIGSGDPLTGDPVLAEQQGTASDALFARVLAALRQRGVRTVSGDLVIDNTIFDDQRFHPSWPIEQANNWYAAQVAGLNFNDNCLDITVRPGTHAGAPAMYALSPAGGFGEIINRTRTVGSGKNTPWASRAHDTNTLTLRGNVRSEQTFSVAIDRPGAFFGFSLVEYLRRHGVTVRGRLIIKRLRGGDGRLPVDLDVLAVDRTSLSDVLRRANERSLNLAAECLLKTLGAYHDRPPGVVCRQGTWANGAAAVRGFLASADALTPGIVIDDGSGLSRKNRISAQALTAVLVHMHEHRAGDTFRASLARPGVGTLRRRFGDVQLGDRLFAKTGYISGAWALSGYGVTSEGRTLAFSIIGNRARGGSLRPVIDDIVKAMLR